MRGAFPGAHGAARPVGRDDEIGAATAFLLDDGPGTGLVLEGPAGIGKTTVWSEALQAARQSGARVLVSRPASQDVQLGFAGLADLLEESQEAFANLPGPQRRALETALLLQDGPLTDERAVYSAVLSLLRIIAREARVAVAVDDLQWLDGASASALAFAARRLDRAPVHFLFTERVPAPPGNHELLVSATTLARLPIKPLSFGAIGRIVHDALGLTLSRPAARRLYDASGGNPLFAVELARRIAALPGSVAVDQLPLPERIESALSGRLAGLAAETRSALLCVALSGDPQLADLVTLVGDGAVDDALRQEVLVRDGARVRLAHPLLGELAKSHAALSDIRRLHGRIAHITEDEERRAVHLSEATIGEDAEVAELVFRAAAQAAARGATATAAALGERGLSLTPQADSRRLERLLQVAGYAHDAGELSRVMDLLPPLESIPSGSLRARAALLFAGATDSTALEVRDLLKLALAEAEPGSEIKANALHRLSFNAAVGRVADIPEAQELAFAAVRLAHTRRDVPGERAALAALMWARALGGLPIDDCVRQYDALPEELERLYDSGLRAQGVVSMWGGEIPRARELFTRALSLADERDEGEAYFALRLQLCELELRAARWSVVAELLAEWERERAEAAGHQAALWRCQALLAAGRGDGMTAHTLAARAIAAADALGIAWHRLEALRAQGLAALLRGDSSAAVASLGQVWGHTEAAGVKNPGTFPVAPDLIAALVAHGEMDEARAVQATLARRAAEQDHPWATVAGSAGEGHLELAQQEDSAAAASFAIAADQFGELGFPFDQARCLIRLGVAERRQRHKRQAKEALERATALFEALGSPGWAEQARSELGRIGGRRSSENTLTATEQRVAELVAEGLANKQVASALVITVATVEAHLTRIYNKLGIRSRTELARLMATRTS